MRGCRAGSFPFSVVVSIVVTSVELQQLTGEQAEDVQQPTELSAALHSSLSQRSVQRQRQV